MQLSVGSLFPNKVSLKNAIKKLYILTDRSYIVTRSNDTQFIAQCIEKEYKWGLRAARMVKHEYFKITVNKELHRYLVNQPLQDHRKLSVRMISKIVKPLVS